ncbi:MAG: LysR family transcriptional regulator [Gammaproteobacteria bacterium]
MTGGGRRPESRAVPASRAAEILTLRRMKYFLAVADTRQITVAARQINISPAAVTTAVHRLESFLDVALFERRRDGMVLTRDGMRFQRYCEKILNLAEDAERLWSEPAGAPGGELRLAASPAVHGYFLPPLLARFCRLFRGVRVSLFEMRRGRIEDELREGKIDAGFMLTSNIGGRGDLAVLDIASSRRTLWCDAHHRFALMKTVPLAELAGERYIQLTIDEAEENTRMFFSQHGARRRCFLRTETVEAVRSYVAQGTGVTILSEALFRPWSLEGDRVLSRPVAESIPRMRIGLAHAARRELPPPARALRDFVAYQWMRRDAPDGAESE